MKIALSTSLKDASLDQLKSRDYCKQFMGALFLPLLIQKLEKKRA
jgi:hypothetical protein